MALDTPTWLQNGTYSARLDRIFADSLLTEGVMRPGAGQLLVTQRGAGVNDSVDIAAGYAVISGDDTPDQGNYIVRNTGTVNLPAAAAPVANSRIDLVCLRVNDPAAGGPVGDDAQFVYVSGVAAGSPVPPATPTSAIALARVLRTVGDTTVVNANITDARPASLTLLSNTLTTAGDLFSFDGSNSIRVPLGSVGLPLVAGATSVGYAQVGTAGIADGAVTSAKILDGTIATVDIANSAVTLAKLNADVVPSKTRKGCYLTDASTSGASGTALTWATELDDSGGFHVAASADIVIPSGEGGLYVVTLSGVINASNTLAYLELQVNGTGIAVALPGGAFQSANVSTVLPLNAGDTLRAVRQYPTGTFSGPTSSFFSAYRIGA